MADFTIKAIDPSTGESVSYQGTAEDVFVEQEAEELQSGELLDAKKIFGNPNITITLEDVDFDTLDDTKHSWTIRFNESAGGGTQKISAHSWARRNLVECGRHRGIVEFKDQFGNVEDVFYTEYIVAIVKNIR